MIWIAVALAAAAVWALSSTLLASQTKQVDTISISALRAFWAIPFFVAALFAFGAQSDIAKMSLGDILQIFGQGVVGPTLGDTLYVAAIAMLGMTRAFTTVMGLYGLMAYVWAAIFLGESVSWEVAAGSVLVITGVYLVALYGRPRRTTAPEPTRRWAWARRRKPSSIAGGSGAEKGRTAARSTHAAPSESRSPPPPQRDAIPLPWGGSLRPRVGLGIAAALLVGLLWSGSSVWLRSISDGVDASAVGMVRVPFIAMILLGASWFVRGSTLRRNRISLRSHWVLALSGIIGTGLTTLLFILAIQEIGAGQTVVLFSTSPLFALPMGFFFLREKITIWVVVGTVVAVAGIILLAA